MRGYLRPQMWSVAAVLNELTHKFRRRPIFLGSSRIGMKLLFQAHVALESTIDFRLISELENAGAEQGQIARR